LSKEISNKLLNSRNKLREGTVLSAALAEVLKRAENLQSNGTAESKKSEEINKMEASGRKY